MRVLKWIWLVFCPKITTALGLSGRKIIHGFNTRSQYANWDFIGFVAIYVLYHVWKSFFFSCFYCTLQLWMKTSCMHKRPCAPIQFVRYFVGGLSISNLLEWRSRTHKTNNCTRRTILLLSYFRQLKLRKMWADNDLFECFGFHPAT